MAAALEHQRLLALLRYDSTTGVFTRLSNDKWHPIKEGAPVGCRDKLGYSRISVDGRRYAAHQLAWFYVHGSWPVGVIDHIDGNPSNNAIANLRDTTQSINSQNRRRPKSGSVSGLLGVSFNRKVGKFQAAIYVNKRLHHLGVFVCPQEAHATYLEAKRSLHEGNTL